MKDKSVWLQKFNRLILKFAQFSTALLEWVAATPMPELLALLLVAALYIMNSVRFELPVGYAGFFALMSDLLADNHFLPPAEVPFYGPGGIPFVYPPLGMYLAGGMVSLLKISMLDYLRWEPALVSILAFIAVYALTRELLVHRIKALLATLCLSTVSIIYVSHATAAGMVRALAFLFSLWLLNIAHKIFSSEQTSRTQIALAALLLGLIALTHLSYLLFSLLSISVFFLHSQRSRFRQNLTQLALIGVGCLVIVLPWYGKVLLQYGVQTFLYASASHGSFGIMHQASGNILAIPELLLSWFYNFGRTWNPYFLAGTGMLGFVYAVFKKRWLLPVWLIVIVLFLGEAARYEVLVACILTADLLGDFAVMGNVERNWKPALQPVAFILAMGLIIGVFFAQGIKQLRARSPVLSEEILAAATWLNESTHPEDVYLLLSDSHDLSEWFPYLSLRTPAIAYWGSEWNGTYEEQQRNFGELGTCLGAGSFSCVVQLLNAIDAEPDYLILPESFADLGEQIRGESDWEVVYNFAGYTIFTSREE